YELTEKAKIELDLHAEKLKEKPFEQLEIEAHTDWDGSLSYNQELSSNRGKTVKNYLVSKGIDEQKINLVNHGEVLPTASNKTRSGMQLNRRVELRTYYDTFHIPQAFLVQSKRYVVNPGIETHLALGNEGTVLHIPE
ncbi:MAG: OmpA family protein, partial [Flavobacteriales bacterium]|nr:OmpA family protein [Flavobacteriales bacterium]